MSEWKAWLAGLVLGVSVMFFFAPVLGAMSRVQSWHHWIGWDVLPVVAGNFLVGYGLTAALEHKPSAQALPTIYGFASVALCVLVLTQFHMPVLSSGGFCGTCQRAGWEGLAAILLSWGIVTKSLLVLLRTGLRRS